MRAPRQAIGPRPAQVLGLILLIAITERRGLRAPESADGGERQPCKLQPVIQGGVLEEELFEEYVGAWLPSFAETLISPRTTTPVIR